MRYTTFVCLVCVLLSGCAITKDGTRSTDGSRALHHVEKRQTQVVLPATESTPAQIVPVVETVESWDDEQVRSLEQTHESGTSGPDLKQIAPAVAAIGGAVATGVTGGTSWLGVGGIAALLTSAVSAIGYGLQKRGESIETKAQAREQVEYHRRDADEGWKLAREGGLRVDPEKA